MILQLVDGFICQSSILSQSFLMSWLGQAGNLPAE